MMTVPELKARLKSDAEVTKEYIDKSLENDTSEVETLYKAMRYSAEGGKRIRAALVIEFCRLFGGDEKAAVPFAAGIELCHASSLIHDDMPCMDNDDLRRGRPTNHKVFGEDIALLAGDALMTKGYETVCKNEFVGEKQALAAAKIILTGSGAEGMMGGQCIDLESENKRISFDALLQMHAKKTGALIKTACCLGVIAAGITEVTAAEYFAACEYAKGVGLAFQITDDILDVTGDSAVLGKNIGSDEKDGKTTFLSFMSVDEAREYARKETDKSTAALRGYPGSDFLTALAEYLISRSE